jgi:signal transduction histidine kinase
VAGGKLCVTMQASAVEPFPARSTVAWRDEERVLLARELHDVVSHSIAAINLQAGVGLHLLSEKPEHAADALHAIQVASRDALHELRTILDRLLEPESEPVAHELPFGARLARLAERATAAGVPTRLEFSGRLRPLPLPVSQGLYRVVQESLTNVLRHSGATSALVSVAFGDDLAVEISDNGAGNEVTAGGPGSGLGIAGMRSRIDALGGSLVASPVVGRGFRVHATVPLGSAP